VGLELYGKIEPLLGFEEQKKALYEIFLHKLLDLGIKRVLDIGCGSGAFMKLLAQNGLEAVGIDLSEQMVQRAKESGLEAYCVDVCAFEGRFECATAVFDVINYLADDEVGPFLRCVADKLEDGGYFLCDINTLLGFEEVAQGSLVLDHLDRFVAVEAEFLDGKLLTDLYLFEREGECYTKQSDRIIQYYHEVQSLKGYGLELVDIDFVELYAQEPDKALLTFQKIT